MRVRKLAVLVVVIAFLFLAQSVMVTWNSGGNFSQKVLSSSPPYSESLALYVTAGETFWRANLVGGNISVSGVSIPSTVSGYSITLTHYDTWNNQFEVFTRYGFGLLGPYEPMPNGTMLVVNTTSSSAASSLANTLGLRFGLAFQPYGNTSNGFLFLSPMDFVTEMHVYFWNLVPAWYGGFASMMTESEFESSDLTYYSLSYSSSSNIYSIAIGGLRPLSAASPFVMYDQLGLSQSSFNYSTSATSSSIVIHVLGGLVSNSSYPYVNNYANFSSTITPKPPTPTNNSVPNVNATINFSYPTLLAYRTVVSPNTTSSLTPAVGDVITVTISVKNISPTGTPAATNVKFNDSWIYSYLSDFSFVSGLNKTGSTTGNLSSGQTISAAYSFKINTAPSGPIVLPATAVTYNFTAAKISFKAASYLNNETLDVGATDTPEIEAIASLSNGVIGGSHAFSVNVSAVNKGDGPASNLFAPGQTLSILNPGATWALNETENPASLSHIVAPIVYPISWTGPSGPGSVSTNNMTAIYSFSSPTTVGLSLSKILTLSKSRTGGNITLFAENAGSSDLKNVSLSDTLPSNVAFSKAYNASSLRLTGNFVSGNVTTLKVGANITLIYSINFSSPMQNYVFLPASASAVLNNQTITHYSQGFGVPLGVVATKKISPQQAFQGSFVNVSVGLVNQGPLPIFNVNLSNTQDSFLSIVSGSSNFKRILNTSQTMNATLSGNLTGSPGTYNSSSAAVSFLFAGTNQTATSTTYQITIYQLLEANLTTSSPKIEEGHDITITITVSNPSNVTVSNVQYTNTVPSGLQLEYGTNENFPVGTLAPHQSMTKTFIIRTGQPFVYTFNGGNLTFSYQNHTLKGVTNGLTLNIADDLALRYGVPVVIGIVLVLAMLLYVRRLASAGKRTS